MTHISPGHGLAGNDINNHICTWGAAASFFFLPGQFGLTASTIHQLAQSMEKVEITPDYNFRLFRTGETIPPVQEYKSSIKSDFANLSISNYFQVRSDAFSNILLMVQ